MVRKAGDFGHIAAHNEIDATLATQVVTNAAKLDAADLDAATTTIDANPASAYRVQADARQNATFAIANPVLVVTYNGDGSVASTTEDGVVSTFTYNGDGTVATQTRAGVTKTFSYGAYGVTGAI